MTYNNDIQKKYQEEKSKLRDSFTAAFDFLTDIESRHKTGFHIGTHKNLHLYFKDNFLFYFEIITNKVIRISSKPNGIIKRGTINNSNYFFQHFIEKFSLSPLVKDDNFQITTISDKYDIIANNSSNALLFFKLINDTLNHIQKQEKLIEFTNDLSDIDIQLQVYNVEKSQVDKDLLEGVQKVLTITTYERNKEAREKCIEIHKCMCAVCGFDFEKTYGNFGKGYIHVHHLKPISEIRTEYKIDPENDLVPICPNCHSIIHRDKNKILTINELKDIINKEKNNNG